MGRIFIESTIELGPESDGIDDQRYPRVITYHATPVGTPAPFGGEWRRESP
ncbi:MAG: hypothetical protein ACREXJ_10385 [Gammaproteobacteria bacterium]